MMVDQASDVAREGQWGISGARVRREREYLPPMNLWPHQTWRTPVAIFRATRAVDDACLGRSVGGEGECLITAVGRIASKLREVGSFGLAVNVYYS
jgi:hypothetical protein